MNRNVKIAYIGILSAIAIILGYLEQMIPMPIAFPGVKLGISNICVLLSLYLFTPTYAFFIMIIKSIVCTLLFYGPEGLIFSLSGALLSFTAMTLIKKIKCFSEVGVSVAGAIFHNLGQMLAFYFVLGSFSVFYYMGILGVFGVITGIITGIISKIVINRLNLKK